MDEEDEVEVEEDFEEEDVVYVELDEVAESKKVEIHQL